MYNCRNFSFVSLLLLVTAFLITSIQSREIKIDTQTDLTQVEGSLNTCFYEDNYNDVCEQSSELPGTTGFWSSCRSSECDLSVVVGKLTMIELPISVKIHSNVQGTTADIRIRYRADSTSPVYNLPGAVVSETIGWETSRDFDLLAIDGLNANTEIVFRLASGFGGDVLDHIVFTLLAPKCLINNETGPNLYTEPISETQRTGVVVWTGTTEDTIDQISYESKYFFILESPTSVLLSVTSEFAAYIDTERKNPVQVDLTVYCDGVDYKIYTLNVLVKDENTKAPILSPTYDPMNIVLGPGWNASVPLNWNHPLNIKDEDFDRENAIVECTSSDTAVRVALSLTNGDSSKPYSWNILFYLLDESRPELFTTIVCSDGVYPAQYSLRIEILFDLFKPEFTELYYLGVHESSSGENFPQPGEYLDMDIPLKATDPDDPFTPVQYTFVPDVIEMDGGGRLRFTKTWDTWYPLIVRATAHDRAGNTAEVPIIVHFRIYPNTQDTCPPCGTLPYTI